MLRCIVAICLLAVCWAQDCQVANIKVMESFDRTKFAGVWYAVAKKDPVGLFLLDNIMTNYEIQQDGTMTATAEGRVIVFNMELCANMFGTFENTPESAKFKIRYWGASAMLQTGYDDHWVIDTDYENYAVHYACRQLDDDGTCLDSYSLIFSRQAAGLRPEDQYIVTQKKQELCLLGKYRRVAHDGYCALQTPT